LVAFSLVGSKSPSLAADRLFQGPIPVSWSIATHAPNLLTLLKRGDVSESSFAFRVRDNGSTIERKTGSGGKRIVTRTLTALDLVDVSPVTYPAYQGTSATARDRELIARFAAREKAAADLEARGQRLRLVGERLAADDASRAAEMEARGKRLSDSARLLSVPSLLGSLIPTPKRSLRRV
jgi:hypothetical protein